VNKAELEGVMMSIAQLFGFLRKSQSSPTNNTPQPFYRTIYPESVRYAFQYKGAEMGKQELLALIDGYIFETVYLVTKALVFDREYQRRFLEELTRLYAKSGWNRGELAEILAHSIAVLPENSTVTGTKLAQISRSGAEEWQTAWRTMVQKLYEEKPDALPCLIAHSPLFGYHHFIEVYRQRPYAKLIVLMPDWLGNEAEEQMGSRYNSDHQSRTFLLVKSGK
jgi:hypothetical protein